MSWLSWLLFESFWTLSALLVVALFVLLVYWRRRSKPGPLLIGIGVAFVLLVLQNVVTTQREHARQIMDAVVHDLVESRTAALEAALAADFNAGEVSGQSLDRDAFLQLVRRRLQTVNLRWVQTWQLKVADSAADSFTIAVSYLSEATADRNAGTIRSRWRITFTRKPDGWKISNIQPEYIDVLSDANWGRIWTP